MEIARKAHIMKTKGNRYLIYIPAILSNDSDFPFKDMKTVPVKISFEIGGKELIIEKAENT